MSVLARANALVDLGRFDDALAALSSAPSDADAALLRAQCMLALRRPAEAEQQAREALAQGAEGEWVWRLLAYALLQRRRPAEAVAAAQASVEAAPQSHLTHITLSDCRRAQGHAGLALQSASEAARLAPDQPASHVAVSRSLLAAEIPDRAEAAARTALKLAPQDADAAAALAEVLESMHRLGEAQDVRLAGVVSNPASNERVGGLADVTHTVLLAAIGINLLPVLLLLDGSIKPMDALTTSCACWALTGGAFLLLRRRVQRSLSEGARRALAPHRRRQDRAYVAGLAVPLLAMTVSAVWDAAGSGPWWPVLVLVALSIAAGWLGTQGMDRREGGAVVREWLGSRGRSASDWRSNQRTARRSQQLLRPVPPVGAQAEEHAPAAVFVRNASFHPHVYAPLCAGVWGLWLPPAPWLALPAALAVAAVDAAVTDNLWPGLARRTASLWTLDGLHVRVVDAETGGPPGWGRSALRGSMRLLLLPYLFPQAFRRRREVWVAPHDRLTGTRVVRIVSHLAAEHHSASSVPPRLTPASD